MADIAGKLRMTTPGRIRIAAGLPMTDQWTENLRCHGCRHIGIASFSQQDGARMPTVLSVSNGFKVIHTEYGPDLHCLTCNIAAVP